MRPQQKSRRSSSASQSQASRRDSRSTTGEGPAHRSSSSRRGTTSEMGKRDKWIWLNVGGTYFLTNNSTLTRLTASNSPLYCLATNSTNVPFERDERGAFLIDRDPAYFSVLLNFLRHGHLLLTRDTSEEGLLLEAEYFIVPDLQRVLKQRCQNRTLNYLINQQQQQSSNNLLLNGQHQQLLAIEAGKNSTQLGLIESNVNQLANHLAAAASMGGSSLQPLASSSASGVSSSGASSGGSGPGRANTPGGGGSSRGLFNSFGLSPFVGPSSGYSGLLEV